MSAKTDVMPDQGLSTVFMEARAALARFLVARGASAVEADDLLQDLYVKLLESARGPIAEPRAYLYRMANNLMLDRRRSAMRRQRREEGWTAAQAGEQLGIDDRPSAEDNLIAREHLQLVDDALAALPERTGDIFRRFRLAGEAQRNIARDLAISVSAVEKHLQRAYRAVIDARGRIDAEVAPPRRHPNERGSHDA